MSRHRRRGTRRRGMSRRRRRGMSRRRGTRRLGIRRRGMRRRVSRRCGVCHCSCESQRHGAGDRVAATCGAGKSGALNDGQRAASDERSISLVRHDHEGHSVLRKPQTLQDHRVGPWLAAVFLMLCPVRALGLTRDANQKTATAVYEPDIIAIKHGLVNLLHKLISPPSQLSRHHSLVFF